MRRRIGKTLYPHVSHNITVTRKGDYDDKCKVSVYIDQYEFGYNYPHSGWLTIDLNGHTLTINSLAAGNQLTVKNGTLNCVFSDYSCGTLTLDNLNIMMMMVIGETTAHGILQISFSKITVR